MGLPRGTTIRLTPVRRLMADFLWASQRVPTVAIERMMPLADVIAARQSANPRPSWFAIFMKAYAMVSARRPELRRAYLSWPWERIHQHACNVGCLAIPRRVGDSDGVFGFQIRYPEQLSLAEIDSRIRAARTEPVEKIADFRRQLLLARLPRLLRRLAWRAGLDVSGHWRAKYAGTFGVTGVAALGSASLSLLSPSSTTITYGVFDDKGRATVRLFYDHRVLDGVEPAAAMQDLEETLCGAICTELRATSAAPRLAA
jgi:hypothetical protein